MRLFLHSVLAAVALAGPVRDSSLRYSVSGRASVTDAEVAQFDYFAEYSAAAYCNSEVDDGTPVTCANSGCPNVEAAKATVTATVSGLITDLQGFIATDPKNELVVVSLRGSASIRNWISDLVFIQVGCDLGDGCLVHAGFATAWAEIGDATLEAVRAAKEANPAYKVVFTGHSLGAAVATLGAAHARREEGLGDVDLYTFGSPRVGNLGLVRYVTDQPGLEYRVTHLDDPVPRLPPILLNYRHTSPEYWFHTGDANTTDYTAADAKVCDGHASLACNAGTLGLDVDAHGHYFQDMAACGSGETPFRRRRHAPRADAEDTAAAATTPRVGSIALGLDIRDVTRDLATKEPEILSDDELLARINEMAQKDVEFAKDLQE